MSFISDFVMGMGGNDSGVRFSNPSEEETCDGASNSKSSFFQRIVGSYHVGGDTSRLRMRAQPFTNSLDRELIPVTTIIPLSTFGGARSSGHGDVRASLSVRRSHSVGSLSSPPAVVGNEWVRDDVLKYRSLITFAASVAALQRQLRLTDPEDSWKIVIQAYKSDDFPFMRAMLSYPPFFFMYHCLFEVLGLVLPLNSFNVLRLSIWM